MEPQNKSQVENTQPTQVQVSKSNKKIWVILGILVILLLVGGGYYYQSNKVDTKMENKEVKPLDYEQALEYIKAYAKFEGVNLNEDLTINNQNEIRGKIGAAELQYISEKHLLIARGLIDKRLSEAKPEFREELLAELNKMYEQDHKSFDPYYIEYDKTASFLDSEFPEILNFRLDFMDGNLSTKDFVKIVDKMMTFTYSFMLNEYQSIVDKIYERRQAQINGN